MISILLASYGPQSQRYLDLCFKSLKAQTFQDFEVIHVSSGEFKPSSQATQHFHSNERLHYPSAVAKAYEHSNPANPFILFLNDDVILNKRCLFYMVNASALGNMIINPLSNCDDNGRFYLTETKFNKLQYRIDEMEQICDDVVTHEHEFPFLLFPMEIAHLYCSMIRRETYEAIGGIDTAYRTGFDDRDLSNRAKRVGANAMVFTKAYALHGSGVSADLHLTLDDRQFNQKYFMEKHVST